MNIREGSVGSDAAPATRTRPGRLSGTLAGYLSLTKPRVIELLLVTTIPAMLLADRGHVDLVLILSTLFGGMLAAGGANTLNCVAVYTLLLKRRTPQNVVWGGAAGCMPVMIGWSAVTGTIGWQALVMFAVIFFWTPPHTWALAMRYKDDYRAAGIPMLPVVATERQVARQIVVYTWLTVVATLALIPATGWLYAVVAVLAGTWFLAQAYRLQAGVRRGDTVKPLRLFLQSNNYLSALFFALAVDSVAALPGVLGLPLG
ncbi:MAG: protoheme IX farnesyltransferase [Mycobacteriaceae bacterium]|nr:protoheme IX farnesyltransferase [Mycobacteriaceae bacterium]